MAVTHASKGRVSKIDQPPPPYPLFEGNGFGNREWYQESFAIV